MQIPEDKQISRLKHHAIFHELHQAIEAGHYNHGQRLPSEIELAQRFGVSRPTIARALRDLEAAGRIKRRAGSGTYVELTNPRSTFVFGLLMPDLGEAEIVEPICQGLAQAAHGAHQQLLWGRTTAGYSKRKQAQELCDQFIRRKVSGVFFVPVELEEGKDEVNARIANSLDEAGVPIVLVDRDIVPFPLRSKHDLVGIDNRRVGYIAAEHFVRLGARRVMFFARTNSAPTLHSRIAGFIEALRRYGLPIVPELVKWGDPSDTRFVQEILDQVQPDAVVCGNDRTAAYLMQSLNTLEVRVPDQIRIAGVDDLTYARLLQVPLTTIRQPCREIGMEAAQTMLTRIANRNLPARDILLDTELVIRKSCGSQLRPRGK